MTIFMITTKSEDWDGRPSPGVNTDITKYTDIQEARAIQQSTLHEYSKPQRKILTHSSLMCDKLEIGYVEPPDEEHHTMPIRGTIVSELFVLTKSRGLVSTQFIGTDAIKKEILEP